MTWGRDGFDGIDLVALEVAYATPLVQLYGDLLGFEVASDGPPAESDDDLATLFGLHAQPRRVVLLRRGASAGGQVLVLETGAPAPGHADLSPVRTGPYALDLYLRDAEATEAGLASAGWSFTSSAVHYDLPGTDIPVREHMLVQPHSGLLHALVQHRPGGTRSVLSDSDDGVSSEVVALVVMTADLEGARAFARDVLGAHEYFHDVFAGPAVERMLHLPAGHGLDASLFRGPASRNARLEFARPVDQDGLPRLLSPADPDRPSTGACLVVDDLDVLSERLADGEHGRLGGAGAVSLAGVPFRGVRFDTGYGVTLTLLERTDPQR